MSFKIAWSWFCYLDTEYVRPDYRVAPIDKFAATNIDLFCIQYATFKPRRIRWRQLPKLSVIQRNSEDDEVTILKAFLPIWKRFFGNVKRSNRLIPTGFVVMADLMILANKYAAYQDELLEDEPNLSPKLFSVVHVLQMSRFVDLQWPFQLNHGYFDISLRELTKNNTLQNKETKTIIQQLLTDGVNQTTRVQLENQFKQYVHEEYHAVMKGLKIILRKLPGIYRTDKS